MAKAAVPGKRAATGPISLKVTLRDIMPPIWRRMLMPGNSNLYDVHVAIQVTMGWTDSHLHSFDVGGQRYGDPTLGDDVANEARLTLNSMVKSGISRFRYTYDFGDDWDHDVSIETPPPAHSATSFPACVAGKRRCPPEDCGGTPGYADLLDALADPAHPQHSERTEWIGEAFDPEYFSLPAADAMLATAFRRKGAR